MEHKILIVDDAPVIHDSFDYFLSGFDVQVKHADNAQQALELLQKESFDLILSDIRMPEMDGIELLNQLKEISPKTGVILMTGYGSSEIAKQAVNEGALMYLQKPFLDEDLEKLNELISSTLKR